MFQVLFFPRLKEVSSWKTKKQGIISPNGGNRRGIFGSALKKYSVQMASMLFMKSKVVLTASLCVYALYHSSCGRLS